MNEDSTNNGTKKVSGNNVEFYAEIIGKLIGTVRDGITTLIDDVKQRKLQQQQQQRKRTNVTIEAKNQKIKSHQANVTTMKGVNQTPNKTDTREMQMKIDVTPISAQNVSTATAVVGSANEQMEIVLTTLADVNIDDWDEDDDEEESEKIKAQSEPSLLAWTDVVQIIARKTKYKRSETLLPWNVNDDDDGRDAMQLEIPIDSDSFDGKMTNERVTTDNGSWDESNQQELEGEIDSDHDDDGWFTKHRNLFANLTNNHRRRKEKLIRLIYQFIRPTDDEIDDRGTSQTPTDEPRLSFAIKRGNATIIHLTPRQFLRIFHRGTDEHAEFQSKAKTTLQKAFYKYARIYLKARKGYKDARNFNRNVRQHHLDDDNQPPTSTQDFLSDEEIFSNVADQLENVNEFMTNDARSNLQTVEAFAILILEIFGAIMGLTIGAYHQIQSSYFPAGLN